MWHLYCRAIYSNSFWAAHFLSFCRVGIGIKARRISVTSQSFVRSPSIGLQNVSVRYYHAFLACTVFALFVLFVFVPVLTAQWALAKDH